MKAVLWKKYGGVDALEVGEAPTPQPGPDEILVRIYASTVTAGDCEMRSQKLPFLLSIPLRIWIGFLKPRPGTIPGTELAGVVEKIGENVSRYMVGDKVFGGTGLSFRANAEYICMQESPQEMAGGLIQMPENMSFHEAATIPFGARDALHFIRHSHLRAGDKILINGAGGSIGIFAVQFAKNLGAEVTAVDSGEKLEMLKDFGADHVIDYIKQDFTKSNLIYDVIFDVVGTVRFRKANRVLKEGGLYVLANPMRQMLGAFLTNAFTSRRVFMQAAGSTFEELEYCRKEIEEDRLKTYIDRMFPLEQVREAHAYVETGRKQGHVVLEIK